MDAPSFRSKILSTPSHAYKLPSFSKQIGNDSLEKEIKIADYFFSKKIKKMKKPVPAADKSIDLNIGNILSSSAQGSSDNVSEKEAFKVYGAKYLDDHLQDKYISMFDVLENNKNIPVERITVVQGKITSGDIDERLGKKIEGYYKEAFKSMPNPYKITGKFQISNPYERAKEFHQRKQFTIAKASGQIGLNVAVASIERNLNRLR